MKDKCPHCAAKLPEDVGDVCPACDTPLKEPISAERLVDEIDDVDDVEAFAGLPTVGSSGGLQETVPAMASASADAPVAQEEGVVPRDREEEAPTNPSVANEGLSNGAAAPFVIEPEADLRLISIFGRPLGHEAPVVKPGVNGTALPVDEIDPDSWLVSIPPVDVRMPRTTPVSKPIIVEPPPPPAENLQPPAETPPPLADLPQSMRRPPPRGRWAVAAVAVLMVAFGAWAIGRGVFLRGRPTASPVETVTQLADATPVDTEDMAGTETPVDIETVEPTASQALATDTPEVDTQETPSPTEAAATPSVTLAPTAPTAAPTATAAMSVAPATASPTPAMTATASATPTAEPTPSPAGTQAAVLASPTPSPKPTLSRAQRRQRAKEAVVRGEKYFNKNMVAEAHKEFDKALRWSPAYPDAHRWLGVVCQTEQKNAEARRHYERYLKLAPNAKDAANIRAVLAGMEPAQATPAPK